MDSGFNDKGYSVTLTNVNLGSNPTVTLSSTTINISGRDIYNTVIPGVFRINQLGSTFLVFSSAIALSDIMNSDACDAFLVYPGWGFILYNGNANRFENPTSSWTNISRFYFNDTNAPLLFSCIDNTHIYPESSSGAIRILINNSNSNFPVNSANAIQIFFRSNTSYVIPGIRQEL